jgi:hypothetical protein
MVSCNASLDIVSQFSIKFTAVTLDLSHYVSYTEYTRRFERWLYSHLHVTQMSTTGCAWKVCGLCVIFKMTDYKICKAKMQNKKVNRETKASNNKIIYNSINIKKCNNYIFKLFLVSLISVGREFRVMKVKVNVRTKEICKMPKNAFGKYVYSVRYIVVIRASDSVRKIELLLTWKISIQTVPGLILTP